MGKRATVSLLLILSAVPIRGQPQTSQGAAPRPPAPEAPPPARLQPTAFGQFVERLEAGDRTVDFTELRLAYTETPAYTGMMMGFYRSLWGTLNARDFEGALTIADTVFERSYAEPNAHMVAALAHSQSGHREQEQFHRFIAAGLLRSITSHGDGKTPETAYQVIDTSEEYALFRSLNLTPKSQSSGPPTSGGAITDRMVVVDSRTNEERVIYFTVDSPGAAALRRQVTQPR